jgi:hypothetical protein
MNCVEEYDMMTKTSIRVIRKKKCLKCCLISMRAKMFGAETKESIIGVGNKPK